MPPWCRKPPQGRIRTSINIVLFSSLLNNIKTVVSVSSVPNASTVPLAEMRIAERTAHPASAGYSVSDDGPVKLHITSLLNKCSVQYPPSGLRRKRINARTQTADTEFRDAVFRRKMHIHHQTGCRIVHAER